MAARVLILEHYIMRVKLRWEIPTSPLPSPIVNPFPSHPYIPLLRIWTARNQKTLFEMMSSILDCWRHQAHLPSTSSTTIQVSLPTACETGFEFRRLNLSFSYASGPLGSDSEKVPPHQLQAISPNAMVGNPTTWKNNTHPQWWRDPGLRRNVFWIAVLYFGL